MIVNLADFWCWFELLILCLVYWLEVVRSLAQRAPARLPPAHTNLCCTTGLAGGGGRTLATHSTG